MEEPMIEYQDEDLSYLEHLVPPDEEPGAAAGPEMDLAAEVKNAAFRLLSSCHMRPAPEVLELVALIRTAKPALEVLDDASRDTLLAAVECLEYEAGEAVGVVDLADLPAVVVYATPVAALLGRAAVERQVSSNPAAEWLAVLELVARDRTLKQVKRLADRITRRERTAKVLEAFQEIEPPTARRGTVRARKVRTASQVAHDERALASSRPAVRFSSGYRSLDVWMTNKSTGEPLGFIAPGEGVVFAAGTGQGKSSFSYLLVPSLSWDLANWGYSDAKVYFAHTEESSGVKVKAMELGPGQRYHHLADTIVIADVGSSREAFVMGLYDLVVEAFERSQDTGRPIVQFLPHIVVLDYIQALSGEGDRNEVESTLKTAELILRGVQAWNPDELRKFSGIDFATYAGMSWPDGMEDHQVATVVFAQLVKSSGKGPYRPGSRDCQLSDYVILDGNGDPLWEVQEGDQAVLGKDAIRGSGVILQNATSIVFLHRSNIHAGRVTGEDGRSHLTDTRARLIIDKMRNSALSPVVPMAFDSQLSGFRGQYFDPLGEEALVAARFTPADGWRDSGDPMLPRRPKARPLMAYSYR